jgi:hypothetical protein
VRERNQPFAVRLFRGLATLLWLYMAALALYSLAAKLPQRWCVPCSALPIPMGELLVTPRQQFSTLWASQWLYRSPRRVMWGACLRSCWAWRFSGLSSSIGSRAEAARRAGRAPPFPQATTKWLGSGLRGIPKKTPAARRVLALGFAQPSLELPHHGQDIDDVPGDSSPRRGDAEKLPLVRAGGSLARPDLLALGGLVRDGHP